MKQALVSCGLSKFLLTNGAGFIARNSGTAQFYQAAAHLPHRVLPWIPRPVKGGQRGGQDPGCEELEQEMGNAQEQRPATDALARAPLIVAQPQLFDLVEVDLNLEASGIGVDRFHGSKSEVGTQQVPRREGEARDGDNHHAGRQRAVRPHAAQEDGGIVHLDEALATPDSQDCLLLTQVPREAGEQVLDPARLAKHARAALARRAAGGK
jgi:hypothetical protein